MFDELQEKSKQERKIIPHPYIPFVFIRDGKYFCTSHFTQNGMNRGQMRQHLSGKKHEIAFDTGNKIRIIENFSEIIKEVKNQESIKSKEYFSETYKKVMMICSCPDKYLAVIFAKNELEGQLKDDILKYILFVPDEDKKISNVNVNYYNSIAI